MISWKNCCPEGRLLKDLLNILYHRGLITVTELYNIEGRHLLECGVCKPYEAEGIKLLWPNAKEGE